MNGFTFKAVVKAKKEPAPKHLSKILYCLAKHNDKGEWEAHINTKGYKNYNDLTILPFTDKSFNLKGRIDVFRTKKDNKNHWVRIIRNYNESLTNDYIPGLTSLCENCVFSGHIVRVNGVLKFDMSVYQGTLKQCTNLLTESNKQEEDDD